MAYVLLSESRVCNTCGIEKSLSLFSEARGNRDKISNRCKACDILYQKDYRRKNRKEVSQRGRAERLRKKWYAITKLGTICAVCKQTFPVECYDFHHLDPSEKESMISGYLGGVAIERLDYELSKCVLVCANCHRTIHFKG